MPKKQHQCPSCDYVGEVGAMCPVHAYFLVSPSALAEAPRKHLLGRVVDQRYAVVGLLGTGGMATVYAAKDLDTHKPVALKVMLSDLDEGLSAAKRFIREARALSEIDNPRLIRCLGYAASDTIAYMVMELLNGATLDVFLQHRRPDLREITLIAEQLLEGLAAIHDHGIVHRDIKPANVMIAHLERNRGQVKIIDFGLAQVKEEAHKSQPLTRLGDVLGTARYMSPEHSMGSRHVSPTSDIYSLGVILYEMLSGHTPFDGASAVDMLRQHMQSPVPKLVPRPGVDLPPRLEKFVGQCLEKSPQSRFGSGRGALSAFRKLALPTESAIDLTKNWHAPGATNDSANDNVIELIEDPSILMLIDDDFEELPPRP